MRAFDTLSMREWPTLCREKPLLQHRQHIARNAQKGNSCVSAEIEARVETALLQELREQAFLYLESDGLQAVEDASVVAPPSMRSLMEESVGSELLASCRDACLVVLQQLCLALVVLCCIAMF